MVVNYTSSADQTAVKNTQNAGGQAISIQANVGDLNGAKTIVDAATEAFGETDIVVSNAAIGVFQVLEEIKVEDYETNVQCKHLRTHPLGQGKHLLSSRIRTNHKYFIRWRAERIPYCYSR